MVYPTVRGDNMSYIAGGLFHVHVDNHGIV